MLIAFFSMADGVETAANALIAFLFYMRANDKGNLSNFFFYY